MNVCQGQLISFDRLSTFDAHMVQRSGANYANFVKFRKDVYSRDNSSTTAWIVRIVEAAILGAQNAEIASS